MASFKLGILGGAGVRAGLYAAELATHTLASGGIRTENPDFHFPAVVLDNSPWPSFENTGKFSADLAQVKQSRSTSLVAAGCSVVILACNTLDFLLPVSPYQMSLTSELVKNQHHNTFVVGSQELLVALGRPHPPAVQQVITDIIHAIASFGAPLEQLAHSLVTVVPSTATSLVIACTEVSLLTPLLSSLVTIPVVDTLQSTLSRLRRLSSRFTT